MGFWENWWDFGSIYENIPEFFGNNTEVLRELGNGIILKPKKNYGPRGSNSMHLSHVLALSRV